jgi:hypothetical protein
MNLYGFLFGKKQDDKNSTDGNAVETQSSFVPPDTYDGTVTVESGGFFSTVYDFGGSIRDENTQLSQYRSMALYPEVDMAIEDIINESIVFDHDNNAIFLDLKNVESLSPQIKEKIHKEFKNILKLLKFNHHGYDIFRKWYIDARLYFHIIIDDTRPEKGIQEIRLIDPMKIKKIRKVNKENKVINGVQTPIIKSLEEYFLYTDLDPDAIIQTNSSGLKIAVDSISYVHSGLIDSNTKRVIGYLHKAIRPLNMLRQIEDAVVIYRMTRAPERRIFYIDIGNLPKQKAEQYMRELMNRYRNRLVYDQKTGEIKDDRAHLTMLEDYWIPRRDGGKGTEIATLDGGQNLGQMDDVDYLQRKLYRALNVPISRLESNSGFNMGRTTEISRDEVKFFKFIERLRSKFSMLFLDVLKKQLLLKGIITLNDWEKIYQDINFVYNKDSYFNELKENELLREKVDMLNVLSSYEGKYFSTKYIRKHILKQSDDVMEEIDKQISEEQQMAMEAQAQQQAIQASSLTAQADQGTADQKQKTNQ